MKTVLLLTVLSIFSFANENYINMKNCEKIQLSKFTSLVSCHQVDYLIEYKLEDDEEKDNIKKITAITVKDQKIIKSERK
ncbi:hypothetical protein [Poseidonibacter lekithochrous]|uniref:hypothetical protein n=1 Tax=Poseidonibacter lekithochrous TaxID=1904463 RepID=UPI0008FC4095|nr:hypothetical protein [Poseidonibacter lekithochrous]QKJ24288.1 hypothetical protein ALEK_3077 [Poseidonibacter lekithochrous]